MAAPVHSLSHLLPKRSDRSYSANLTAFVSRFSRLAAAQTVVMVTADRPRYFIDPINCVEVSLSVSLSLLLMLDSVDIFLFPVDHFHFPYHYTPLHPILLLFKTLVCGC